MPPLLLRERYQQLWQQYSQGARASNPVRLDYLVGRRAFEAGCSQQEIARMLTAGSAYVAQVYQKQGPGIARGYVNHTARMACQDEQSLTQGDETRRDQRGKQMER